MKNSLLGKYIISMERGTYRKNAPLCFRDGFAAGRIERWHNRKSFTLVSALKNVVLIAIIILFVQARVEAGSPHKLSSAAVLFETPTVAEESPELAPHMEPGRFARLNTIVIDPGHGGEDTGARGPTGLKEKDVTLKVARTLKKLLQRGLGSQVFLTREDDSNLSLEQRAGIANGLKADLFITIHAGASPERSMRGVQIFLPYASPADLSPSGPGRQSHPVRPEEEVIEWETIHLKYLPLSRVLGRLAQLNLSRVTKREVTMRELPLLTLKGVDMPSFELELGYITNLSSETELKRDTYRDRIAESVYRGIKQYKETLLLMGNPQ